MADPGRLAGRHHGPGPAAADGGITCPRCGATSSGLLCMTCGFSLTPQGQSSSGPPESLFPPVSRPDTVPSSWNRLEPSPPARNPPDPSAPPEPFWPFGDKTGPNPSPVAPPPPPPPPRPSFTPVTWAVLVASDRDYHDRMKATGVLHGPVVSFPEHTTERRIPLTGSQMRIGRRSANGDFEPEIDLAEAPADRGVSRLHAVLIAAPDGTWSLLDSGSSNGTLLNGREVAAGGLVSLREGDRINLGAWTVITVQRG